MKDEEKRKRDGQRTGTGTGADDKGKWIIYSTESYDVQRVKPIPIIICIYDRAEGKKKLEDSMERGSLIITFTEVPRSESSDAQEDEDVIEGKREDGMNVGQNQRRHGGTVHDTAANNSHHVTACASLLSQSVRRPPHLHQSCPTLPRQSSQSPRPRRLNSPQ